MKTAGVFFLGLLIGLAAGYILATQLKADPDNIYVLENGKTDGPDIGPTPDSTIVAVDFIPTFRGEQRRGETYVVDVSESRTAPLYFATDSLAPFVDEAPIPGGYLFGAELLFGAGSGTTTGLTGTGPIGIQFTKSLSDMGPSILFEAKGVRQVLLTPKMSTDPKYQAVWEVDVVPK